VLLGVTSVPRPDTKFASPSPRGRFCDDDTRACSKTLLVSCGPVLPGTFHRVVQRSASPSTSRPESSPTHPRMCFGASLLHAAHGPPSWFLPTLAVYSSCRYAGLLHPAADHEVHRVFVLLRAVCRLRDANVLADAHPSEPSPLEQHPPRHRGLLFPLVVSRLRHRLDLEALLHS
jgi:hypothetical protein